MSVYSVGLALAAKKKAEEEKKEEKEKPEAPTPTPEPLTREERYVESQRFYEETGYAQYAGKYDAPEVPEGYEVKTIMKTKEGLKLQYQYVGKPRSITEMFMTWQPTVLGFQLPAKETLKEAEVSRFTPPGRIVAGLVSTVEAPVYGVGRLVGFETPPVPATVAGGLIGSGMESVLAGKPVASKELQESFRHPEYAFGSIVGEVGLSYLFGKGVEKIVVKPFSMVWKGSKSELWLIKHSRRYGKHAAKGLSPQVVSYPTKQTLSLKSLKAQELAWELSLTPRTSLATVTKVGAKRTVYRFTRGVGYTPMSVTLAKAMSVKDMGGRQALVKIQKPSKAKLPYLPSLSFKKSTTRLPQLPTLSLKGIQSLAIFQKVVTVQKVVQAQIVKQVTIQKQKTSQMLSMPTPTRLTPVFQTPKIPMFRFPRKRVVSTGKHGLHGAWFKRTHPIKTPEEMWRTFTGARGKVKKRRKKRKRKHKKK